MTEKEQQFERIYEKTKDFGRTQFVREIQMQINDNKKKDEIIKQLKKQKDDVIEYINKHCVNEKISKQAGYKCYTMADTNELEKIMRMLGEIDVED